MDRWSWLPLRGRRGIRRARLLPSRRENRPGRSLALPPTGLRDGRPGCSARPPILTVRGVSIQDFLAGGAWLGGWFTAVFGGVDDTASRGLGAPQRAPPTPPSQRGEKNRG